MINIIIVLILFIICSSIKSIYLYIEMGLGYNLLLLHIISTLGISTIFVFSMFRYRRLSLFVIWYLLNTFFLFINTNYFEYFGKFLHLRNVYIFIPEALMFLKNILIPINFDDLIFIVDFPLFLYLIHWHRKYIFPMRYINIIMRTTFGVTALAMVMLLTVPITHIKSQSMSTLEDYEIVSRFGPIGHNILDLLRNTKVNIFNSINYGHTIISNGISGKQPNIILIQVESLDANIVNYRYHGEFVAPFLHTLTHKSLYFPYTLCYRTLGGTSDCEIAVNNSIEPPTDFPLMMNEDYEYPNSVVKILKKSGYIAEAFHGNAGWFYKRLSAYAAMGYDKFFDPKQMNLPEKGWGIPDQDVLFYVEKHLAKVNTPFIVSIITLTSHEPFNNFSHFVPDKRYDEIEPKLTGRYFASIAYTDRVVGEIVANIQKKFTDTYFFIYGDHTPYVINNGPFRRSVLKKENEMEMVPLFIITPDHRNRYEHDAIASYLEIAPTILHATGIKYSYRSQGVDLLNNMSLKQSVIYRGQPYNRSELFKEMSEAFKDSLNYEN